MTDAVDGAVTVERAYEELFRTFHPVLLTAALNRLNHRGDAEDVTAEVFSAAWRRRAEADVVFTLPWLYATLRNIVGNEYRRRERAARRHEKSAAAAAESVVESGYDDEAREIRQLIARLDPPDRELIWMAYWEELTREEMAAILGCSHTALRVRLMRARHRLKTALEHQQRNDSPGRTS